MAITSRFPDIEIPDQTHPKFVLGSVVARNDQEAIVDGAGGRTLTYADLHEEVRRVAAELAARGLRRGDAFAITMPNQLGRQGRSPDGSTSRSSEGER